MKAFSLRRASDKHNALFVPSGLILLSSVICKPMRIALTREISASVNRCELTHLARSPINLDRARAQHRQYEKCLEQCGCRSIRLAGDDALPDCVFIEDTAIVLPEIAILTRPGAPARRAEVTAVAEALSAYRKPVRIEAPAMLDGGDVLVVERRIFVGISSRTNPEAVLQLRALVKPYDFIVQEIGVNGCLHLKSAVTAIGDNLILTNPAWLPPGAFLDFESIHVDPLEPLAANALFVGNHIIGAAAFPRTLDRIIKRGLSVVTVDVSELAKAEGALTCCSLIFDVE